MYKINYTIINQKGGVAAAAISWHDFDIVENEYDSNVTALPTMLGYYLDKFNKLYKSISENYDYYSDIIENTEIEIIVDDSSSMYKKSFKKFINEEFKKTYNLYSSKLKKFLIRYSRRCFFRSFSLYSLFNDQRFQN